MIKIGERAPDFTAKATDGRTLQLSELNKAGKAVVLYFFPKAFTAGWTREAAQFRAAYPEIQKLGGEVIGVSGDSHETQCRFAEETQANFPMVGDQDKKISKAYGTGRAIIGYYKRVTYVIDKGGVVRGVFHHELAVDKHVDEVLAMFRGGF